MPFGAGKRKCIGDQFALFESVVALAMLTRRFTFALDPDSPPVGMTTGATIHTVAGLWMNVTPRVLEPVSAGNGIVVPGETRADAALVELVSQQVVSQ